MIMLSLFLIKLTNIDKSFSLLSFHLNSDSVCSLRLSLKLRLISFASLSCHFEVIDDMFSKITRTINIDSGACDVGYSFDFDDSLYHSLDGIICLGFDSRVFLDFGGDVCLSFIRGSF